MATRCYQLFAAASGANAANFTVVARGRITAVEWITSADVSADNQTGAAEVSFQAVSQLTSNNPNGIISAVTMGYNNASATPFPDTGKNFFVAGLNVPIAPGIIIYLNISSTFNTTSVKCIVHVEE